MEIPERIRVKDSRSKKRRLMKCLRFGSVVLFLCAVGSMAWFVLSLFSQPDGTKLLLSLVLFFLCAVGWLGGFILSLFIEPDISMLPDFHPFKSAKAQMLYLDYYDTQAKLWPVASESKFVDTSFGKTFVRISGPPDAQALVLLPPVSSSSLIWMPNVKTLSEHFRVYAVDNIYDVGRSIYTRAVKTPGDMVGWLDELFTALQLGSSVNLMGLSFGGWITSQYALHFPDRLHKIVLAAPAATVLPLPTEWIWRGILAAVPNRHVMRKVMVNWAFRDLVAKRDEVSRKTVDEIVRSSILALKCFKFKMPLAPTVLEDKDWQGIRVPALFLVGEHEVIYSAQEAVRRLNTVAPHISTEILPGASHDVTIVQADFVNRKVIEFISGGAGSL